MNRDQFRDDILLYLIKIIPNNDEQSKFERVCAELYSAENEVAVVRTTGPTGSGDRGKDFWCDETNLYGAVTTVKKIGQLKTKWKNELLEICNNFADVEQINFYSNQNISDFKQKSLKSYLESIYCEFYPEGPILKINIIDGNNIAWKLHNKNFEWIAENYLHLSVDKKKEKELEKKDKRRKKYPWIYLNPKTQAKYYSLGSLIIIYMIIPPLSLFFSSLFFSKSFLLIQSFSCLITIFYITLCFSVYDKVKLNAANKPQIKTLIIIGLLLSPILSQFIVISLYFELLQYILVMWLGNLVGFYLIYFGKKKIVLQSGDEHTPIH